MNVLKQFNVEKKFKDDPENVYQIKSEKEGNKTVDLKEMTMVKEVEVDGQTTTTTLYLRREKIKGDGQEVSESNETNQLL